ncbi:ATP-binding protein [Natranaerofaba carboxydovora]|uniref:DNA polymerase III subunit n=1 Tax=Natranaerofaba carboxydovora TaxID=2742683 RepID=UPI001F138672|nr:DNA polymerase III subunit [Natranaerofaba carboxydovora]UMZ75241.1 DNA polymerase III subunit tau [Natranaerofaba carboxydovora]
MQFEDFVGQKDIISVLKKKLAEDRIGHAILFCGPNGQGKRTLALLFAKAILCLEQEGSKKDGFCGECISCKKVDKFIHPDLLFIAPQGKSIKIEQVRELKKELLFKPGEGDKKIFIMEDVHAMSNEAANSMLNILEEPPEYVVSVLLTSNLSMLLPTILSRCEIYKFSPVPPKDMYEYFKGNINYNVNHIENDINKAVALSGGRLAKAKMFLENDLYKNQEREIIEAFETFLDKKNRLALFEWAEKLAEKTDEELDMFFEIFTLF